MLRQDFSEKSLLRVTSKNEIIKFELGRDKKEYLDNLKQCSVVINTPSFTLKDIHRKKINNKEIFYAESIEEHYCIKKISSDMKRLYRVVTLNRDDISEQVLRILETGSAFGVIKADVKSFYESISYKKMLDKLKHDKLLSSKSIKFLSDLNSVTNYGLPRGLAISPVMSELYMRDIDSKIREVQGVYYYVRYVDDIFIFTTIECERVFHELKSIFEGYDLTLNKKTVKFNVPVISDFRMFLRSFDYLGYKYRITDIPYIGKRSISVSLSDDKVRKIKTRIVHSIISRGKCHSKLLNAHQSKLLYNRINVLSGNYPISGSKSRSGVLKGGIYYSNRLVNKVGVFEEFNEFLRKSLYSKSNNFFGKCVSSISNEEKKELLGLCFKKGFVDRKYIHMTNKEMSDIKRCWKHQNHKKKK
ncbi:antiviral reverse transcriptase Drt3a [Pseudoalteromonas rhizosphaerae]|uniref:antiviral reverse transcriptase Drt3a n=1 Tax=Pseudoalteromonas rhizosphaerae TaxID=2518973 RepID=UPI0021476115|nr:antiviral reverse transcriptase Drt3a [Pseudoalteromonas rhizosphaerae]